MLSPSRLLPLGDSLLKIVHSRVWPQDGESAVDLSCSNGLNAPFERVVVEHLKPVVKDLGRKKLVRLS